MKQSQVPNSAKKDQSPIKDSCIGLEYTKDIEEKMKKYSNIKHPTNQMPSFLSSYKYTSTEDNSLKHHPNCSERDQIINLENKKTEEMSKLKNKYKEIYSILSKKKHDLMLTREKYISTKLINNNLKQFVLNKIIN